MVTVCVVVPVVLPELMVTEVGLQLPVGSVAPWVLVVKVLQAFAVKFTVPVNPFSAVTVTVKGFVPPRGIVADVGEIETLKSVTLRVAC